MTRRERLALGALLYPGSRYAALLAGLSDDFDLTRDTLPDALRRILNEKWESALSAARLIEEDCARSRVAYILPGDALYPSALFDLALPPLVLYAQGETAFLRQRGVTIVGTRRATWQGLAMAEHIARMAAREGYVVISGGAEGIDSAAHTGALAETGKTIAVLGGGLAGSAPAHERILAQGLLLSEFPPGVPARAFHFIRRNRILAALGRHLFVVQAPKKSGTMITVDWALSLGRGITFCLWPPALKEAEGCRIFYKGVFHTADGTGFLKQEVRYRQFGDILDELRCTANMDERNILFALLSGGRRLPELVRASALPPERALSALTRLELQGRVASAGGRICAV
ncbi:MAG: DNA-protecting protein DprA [Spirochaetota bacterium]|jgi:DNA processing protein|nr:DNA-protecting protein DprA [Spirochaetota bacterium]